MAGYSGTPLAQKLGIKAGSRVALVSAPDGFPAALAPLPAGVVFESASAGAIDVLVCFVTSRLDLEDRFAQLACALTVNGGLWIVWPKRASRIATDLNQNVVRAIGLARGLGDNKVCAVDEVLVRPALRHPPRRAAQGVPLSDAADTLLSRWLLSWRSPPCCQPCAPTPKEPPCRTSSSSHPSSRPATSPRRSTRSAAGSTRASASRRCSAPLARARPSRWRR